MANKKARRPAVPFDTIARSARIAADHAFRIWSLCRHVEDLERDDVPDRHKHAAARILLKRNVGARMVALTGLVLKLNELLYQAPPLSAADEAWLRRQIKTLENGNGGA